MSVRPFLYALLLLLVHPLVACAASEDIASEPSADDAADTVEAPEEYDHLIVAFGDSLYAGYGLEQNEGFAPQLQGTLNEAGQSVRVVNAGVSGDTTAAGRQRVGFTLDGLDETPDLVIVGLGGNDMLRGISPEQTRENLVAIIEEIQGRGSAVMLTGMIAAPNMGADYADAFNPIYSELAAQYDVPLYPFFLDGVIQERSLMLPDGIHPTAEGIGIVVGRIDELVAAELDGSN